MVHVVCELGTARLRPGGIFCHAEARGNQRYGDHGVAVPQRREVQDFGNGARCPISVGPI